MAPGFLRVWGLAGGWRGGEANACSRFLHSGRGSNLPARASKRELMRAHPWASASVLLLGATGLVFAIEGASQGSSLYRLAAAGVGLVCLLPLCVALVFSEAFFFRSKHLALACACAFLAFALAEVGVRFFGSRNFQAPEMVYDDALGHRFIGGKGEPDALGFRNRDVPRRADVVCLGDSQTWGFDVERTDSWPHLLAASTGRVVYNMGIGGYGPLQYMTLTESALALEPSVLLIGFYVENDVINAHSLAGLDRYAELRDPALVYAQNPSAYHLNVKAPPNWAMAVVEGLMGHSRIAWRAMYQIKQRMRVNRQLADLYWKEPHAPRYEHERLSTYFKPEYSASLMDLDLPYVRDGLRISEIALRRIAEPCKQRQVRVALLLIPTKETCYYELCQLRKEPAPPGLERVAGLEEALRAQILRIASDLEWPVVDPRADLVAALAADQPLWPASVDSHYMRAGYAVMVACLRRELANVLAGDSSR